MHVIGRGSPAWLTFTTATPANPALLGASVPTAQEAALVWDGTKDVNLFALMGRQPRSILFHAGPGILIMTGSSPARAGVGCEKQPLPIKADGAEVGVEGTTIAKESTLVADVNGAYFTVFA